MWSGHSRIDATADDSSSERLAVSDNGCDADLDLTASEGDGSGDSAAAASEGNGDGDLDLSDSSGSDEDDALADSKDDGGDQNWFQHFRSLCGLSPHPGDSGERLKMLTVCAGCLAIQSSAERLH